MTDSIWNLLLYGLCLGVFLGGTACVITQVVKWVIRLIYSTLNQ